MWTYEAYPTASEILTFDETLCMYIVTHTVHEIFQLASYRLAAEITIARLPQHLLLLGCRASAFLILILTLVPWKNERKCRHSALPARACPRTFYNWSALREGNGECNSSSRSHTSRCIHVRAEERSRCDAGPCIRG